MVDKQDEADDLLDEDDSRHPGAPQGAVQDRRLAGFDLGGDGCSAGRSQSLEAFESKWQKQFPQIARSWRTCWQNIIPFLAYPPEIRKVIYTTNAIESMQAQLRKVTRKRGSFPTADSVRKVIYLALDRISKKWKRPITDWAAALNHFSILFEGRI